MDSTPHPYLFAGLLVLAFAATAAFVRQVEAHRADVRLSRWVTVAIALVIAGVAVMNVYTVRHPSQLHVVNSDLRLYYSAALIGERHGWSHLYDVALQQHQILTITPGSQFLPFVSPPELAWLAVPATLVSYPLAYKVGVFAAAAAMLAAGLAMPARSPWERVLYPLSLAAAWPAVTAIVFENYSVLFPLLMVVVYRLLRSDRQVLAGLVLALTAFKPHVLILVPLALLLAGYPRAFLSWLVLALVFGAGAFLSLGMEGVRDYLHLVTYASGFPGQVKDATFWWFGSGLVGWIFDAAMVGLLVAVAVRRPRESVELLLSAAIIASLLVNHYLNGLDWAVLVVAIWLGLRARPQFALLFGVLAVGLIGYLHYRPLVLLPAAAVLFALAIPVATSREAETVTTPSEPSRAPRAEPAT